MIIKLIIVILLVLTIVLAYVNFILIYSVYVKKY